MSAPRANAALRPPYHACTAPSTAVPAHLSTSDRPCRSTLAPRFNAQQAIFWSLLGSGSEHFNAMPEPLKLVTETTFRRFERVFRISYPTRIRPAVQNTKFVPMSSAASVH